MSTEQLEELGPIDYIVLEWAGDQPVTGEVMPLLLDLVDRGVIRILDIAFLVKAEDGSVAAIDFAEVAAKGHGPRRVRGRVLRLAQPGRPRRGRHRAGAGHRRRRARVGEPLGRARRRRASPLRRSARRERTHPHPGDPRRARRPRSHRLDKEACPGCGARPAGSVLLRPWNDELVAAPEALEVAADDLFDAGQTGRGLREGLQAQLPCRRATARGRRLNGITASWSSKVHVELVAD